MKKDQNKKIKSETKEKDFNVVEKQSKSEWVNKNFSYPTLTNNIKETINSDFVIREDINKPENIEKIRNVFSFYKNEILPLIISNPKVTQNRDWYHWLYTHTQSVVFRGIC